MKTATKKASTNKAGLVLVEIFDGRAKYAALTGIKGVPGGVVDGARSLAPVEITEGPERCGSGRVTVDTGLIVFVDCYGHHHWLRAKTGTDSRWWNYGAPHGTHVKAVVEWEKVPEAETQGLPIYPE